MISPELVEQYNKLFPESELFEDVAKKIDKLQDDPNQSVYRDIFCSNLLDSVTMGFYKYDEKLDFKKDELIQCLIKQCRKLNQPFYNAIAAFYSGNHNTCISELKAAINTLFAPGTPKMNENDLTGYFINPFKNAFPGFWDGVLSFVDSINCEKGIPELCRAVKLCYESSDNEDIINGLTVALQANPDSVVAKELLGYNFYTMGMWGNAIAYFEQLDKPYVFFYDNILFFTAWSYGKQKNITKEIEYYQKCLDSWEESPNALNNLGYAYYKKKDYIKALSIFEKCINEKRDFPYAINNYVRTLLALGRNKDAKVFLKDAPGKISKTLVGRTRKADNTNARLKKAEEVETVSFVEDDAEVENIIDFGVKKHQFSNEKLLEDELTLRIESGMNVFGLPLKIYRRKGIYGRQYIIPIGRLDLLAEDTEGNLYVIELKKDSGYDDPYKQTVSYIDWFEKNEISAGKKVYGIICLNNPTKQLIDAVRQDDRIKLYEYQISYTEIQ